MTIRRVIGAAVLALALVAMVFTPAASSAPTVRGYVVGSRAPLTVSQVAQLKEPAPESGTSTATLAVRRSA